MNKLILTLSTLCISLPVFSENQFSLDSNAVQINIEQDKNKLLIALSAPSLGLIGYEYNPKTLKEKIAYNRAMTILKNPKTFLAVNEEANCRLSSKNVKYEVGDSKVAQEKGSPTAFLAQYSYSCTHPSQIKDFKSHWFKTFPSTKSISVFASTDKGSKTGEVTARSRRFYF